MRRYFITGGTGFVGRELVRQLLQREDTGIIVCLTRGHRKDLLLDTRVEYWNGDIVDCAFPESDFTDVIHGANEVNDLLQPDQMRYYYTIVEGTERVMKWAALNATVERSLLLSSGAVGRDTIYGRSKRQSERITHNYNFRPWAYKPKIARIYATLGPESPLSGQYAAGQFIGMALKDKQIRYWGGTSVRTYLDVSDTARWLLRILDDGPVLTPVDVAGAEPILVSDLAELVGRVFDVPVVKVDGPTRSDSYLPDLTLADMLGLAPTMTLTQSLERIREHYGLV